MLCFKKSQAGEIYVIGLGPGDPLELPAVNLALMRGRDVYVRTGRHPVVEHLVSEGIAVFPLDRFYEEASSFDEVYRKMADFLIAEALEKGCPVLLGVPGDPLVGETVVQNILAAGPEKGVRVRLWHAPSFLDVICDLLKLDPSKGLLVVDSFDLCGQGKGGDFLAHSSQGIIVFQIFSRVLASEVKLSLMEQFPDDHMVMVVRHAGIRGKEIIREVLLYELDRLQDLDHLTTVYVPPLAFGGGDKKVEGPFALYSLDPLVDVMERLLGPNGCPWDRQQDHMTLKKYLIEEAYEVIDAIDEGNMNKLCEELGDLLLQVVFHSVLAGERGDFSLSDVIKGIIQKLKRRHPHVFGDIKVENADEVLRNWETIKLREATEDESKVKKMRSLLEGVPRHLPALQRAQKVQEKAALVGFDWPDALGAAAKFEEEWQELRSAWARGNEDAVRQELGDLFFAAVNVSRLLQVNAEDALRDAVDKFIRRFQYMEAAARERGIRLQELSPDELDLLWIEAKSQE